MYQKILASLLLIFLLSPIFSMSGGGNVPVDQKEATENPQIVQNTTESLDQSEQVKLYETVKDRFGADTGMTKEEYTKFHDNYINKAENLGIPRIHTVSPEEYFKYKINLNAVEELKSLGLFLDKRVSTNEEIFAYGVTHSDIIIIGTIDSVAYFYKNEKEEWKASGALSRYFVKVDKILKGSEYFTNSPEIVSYFSSIGKFLTTSGDTRLKMGKKYILFLKKHRKSFPANDFLRVKELALGLEGDKIFFSNFKDNYIMSVDEVLLKIKNYEEINNSASFYRRKYLNQEGNGEK